MTISERVDVASKSPPGDLAGRSGSGRREQKPSFWRGATLPGAVIGEKKARSWRQARLRPHRQEVAHHDPIQIAIRGLHYLRQAAVFLGLDTDAELGAERAAVRSDAFAEWPASRIIGGKRPVDVVGDRQVLPPGPAPLLPPWRRRSRPADAVSNPRRPPMPRVRAPNSASRNRRPGEERLVNMFQTIQELRRQPAVRFVAHLSDQLPANERGHLARCSRD